MTYEKTIRVDLHIEDLKKLLHQDIIPQRFVEDEFEVLVLKSSNKLREQTKKSNLKLIALNKSEIEDILYRAREMEQIIADFQFIIRRCPGESINTYKERGLDFGAVSVPSLKIEPKSEIVITASEYDS